MSLNEDGMAEEKLIERIFSLLNKQTIKKI